jgi:hypothetical protein
MTINSEIRDWIELHTEGTERTWDLGAGRFNYTTCSRSAEKIGIEKWEPLVRQYGGQHGVHADMRLTEGLELPDPDVVMLIDSLEHISKDDGRMLLLELQAIAGKILVFTPDGYVVQEEDAWGMDNPWQRHVCGWDSCELSALGFQVDVRPGFHGDHGALFAVWTR